jgi:hypothetical protein
MSVYPPSRQATIYIKEMQYQKPTIYELTYSEADLKTTVSSILQTYYQAQVSDVEPKDMDDLMNHKPTSQVKVQVDIDI